MWNYQCLISIGISYDINIQFFAQLINSFCGWWILENGNVSTTQRYTVFFFLKVGKTPQNIHIKKLEPEIFFTYFKKNSELIHLLST